jgi:hypothetical protein
MIDDETFIRACREHVSAGKIARVLGITERAAKARRARLEKRTGVRLPRGLGYNMEGRNGWAPSGGDAYPQRAEMTIGNGTVVAFGDMHCRPLNMRPGDTPAMSALLRVVERVEPVALVCTGDVLDGASISRHPPLGWETKPALVDEVGGAQHDLHRVAAAAPKARRAWVVGNHDERFDRTLATRAPDYRGIPGTRLADMFPDWPLTWSLMVNGDTLFIHRWHSGVHARWNNAMKGQCHIVSGDTHRAGTTHYSNQTGRTWHSIETGCMADPSGPQFQYVRGVRPNWQMGFVVLTWRDFQLCPPEHCHVDEAGRAWFRGEVIAEKPRVRVRARAEA